MKPHPDYPPEDGRYLRGNDFSPMEFIERFRAQVSLVDLQFKGTPQSIRQAIWSCFQA
ncbi:MAG: hypothetical protein AB1798_03350 [Spirochaetota bacterium]